MTGLRRPLATARRTVAWLTPRRVATSFELINLCKTCAGATHYIRKGVPPGNLGAWNSTSGVGISSLKMCRDRPDCSANPCQNFHCAHVRGPSERNERPHISLEPHPPQPSSEPVSRNRPARAIFTAQGRRASRRRRGRPPLRNPSFHQRRLAASGGRRFGDGPSESGLGLHPV